METNIFVYDLEKIKEKLKKDMDENRYLHTIGVMYTAASMAMAHGYDIHKAQVAGLLHDCAKCIPNDKKLKLCKKNNIPMTAIEQTNPILLHGKLGAFVASKKYDVKDEEVLSSIIYHTTGKSNMTTLDKIIYIADYIEPLRYKQKNLSEIRRLAFCDLDECMYMILRDTLAYLKTNPKSIDPTTSEAFTYYEALHLRKYEE